MHTLTAFLTDENGASAAEYGLILALVAIAIIGGLSALGLSIAFRLGAFGEGLQSLI